MRAHTSGWMALSAIALAIGGCGGGGGAAVTAGEVAAATDQTAAEATAMQTIERARRTYSARPIAVTVTGSGQVSGSPGTLLCGDGATACSTTFNNLTRVTLTAKPKAGSVFAAWGGDCSGTLNVCIVDNSRSRNVTATFKPATAPSPAPTPAPAPAPAPTPAPAPAPAPTPAPAPAPTPAPAPAPTPAPAPAPAPAPTPAPAPAPTTANLCNGLVTDKLAHPMTAVPKPARLAAYTDPNFKTTVRRITDVVAQFGGSYAKPVYSTMPAWNADESYLLLYVPGQGHKLFDGKTYAFIRNLSISPADIEHVYWSASDPDALYFPSGSTLKVYHPKTNTTETLKTFSGGVSFGSDPIYGDWNTDVFGFSGGAGSILWRKSTGVQTAAASTGTPMVGASGQLYVQGQKVYSATTNALQRTLTINTNEHAALGKLANGQDLWISVQFDATSATGGNGNLIATNLATGVNTAIIGEANGWGYPRTGTHLSAHAFKAPGWVAVSMTGSPTGSFYLDQEIALANVNTGVVCRVAHHRSAGQEGTIGYWAEPHVNISPRGTRMIFASDWNNGSTVDTYVVELPSYVP